MEKCREEGEEAEDEAYLFGFVWIYRKNNKKHVLLVF